MDRRLHLLRHAATEDARPGHPDRDRRLTPPGHRQAVELGRWLAASGTRVDLVWCSPAERTRQTCAALGLDAPTTVEPSLYRATAEDVEQLLAGCDPAVASLLVVGHNPTVAELAHTLAAGSDDEASTARRFPPGTLASFALAGWDDLGSARLTGLRLP